jgi:DMSO/TMAO reductase YedYZ molybdopterin-dependent catalytic subunit
LDRPARSERLGLVPFVGEDEVPMDTPYGSGLDGRLNTDLSKLTAETLTTGNDRFFIRTRFPDGLAPRSPWNIEVGGLVRRPSPLTLESLHKRAHECGLHVMDCAGNTRLRRFGLVSAARWQGVPIAQALPELEASRGGTRIQIFGFDRQAPARATARDASWVFTFDDLASTRAFLATGMNGAPLARDHGAPVRLVVPGWYSCASVKWVDRIALVDDAVATTLQMREYAPHTNQGGVPQRAKEYRSPIAEPAALPIRIEKWKRSGRISYRVVGLVWGDFRPSDSLTIRFDPETHALSVATTPPGTAWTLWTHEWTPARPGTYRIDLRIADASRARRLESGFYARSVRIDPA